MYVKIISGTVNQYPYTIGQLRRDNPNTSFPKTIPEAILADYGVFPVGYQAAPDFDKRTQYITHSDVPELVNGKWTLTKTLHDKTSEQIADYDAGIAKQVRQERNQLLADTDWWAVSDRTMTAEMTTYRQALRDITDHANFPYLQDADWPVKP